MSLTPEERPETAPADAGFDPRDWLGARNSRNVIHVGRDTLLKSVRLRLNALEPQLAINQGVCFYETYGEDGSSYKILVTDHPKVAAPLSTVVAVNKIRSTNSGEPCFPDGRVLELTDLSLHHSTRWLNSAWETQYRGQHDHSWETPKFATLLQSRMDSVAVIGQLATGFEPVAALDTDEVSTQFEALWTAYSALSLCTPSALRDEITTIKA